MSNVTAPLHREHRKLTPYIDALRSTAESVGQVPVGQLVDETDAAYRFLTRQLIPHAAAEDEVLYPVVGEAMGSELATATMRRDHIEVQRLTDELGALRWRLHRTDSLTSEMAADLRRVLFGLYSVISLHFQKEEEVYLPLLDQQLTERAAEELFSRLEAVELSHH